MANIALIMAGGIGARMNQDIPKQFISVYDKPVIVYTMEAFQTHPDIDAIEVVCLDGWKDVLWAYAKQFGIAKLENVIIGGPTGQDSIRNGVYDVAERYHGRDDIVLVHDGIRPMVSHEVITDNIRVCKQYGNAIAVVNCTAAMLITEDYKSSTSQFPRDNLKYTQTPQAFYLRELVEAHKEAIAKGKINTVASCSMYTELGKKLYFSRGSEKNVKLTTTEDIEIFKALLIAKNESWIH